MPEIGPRFPLYIPSKSRSQYGHTMKKLARMNVPFRIVVEESQRDDYARAFGAERLLILDPQYQRDYDACIDLEPGASKGSGPARNFIWDHAVSEGHEWHWIMDDNIREFFRFHNNQRIPVGDGSFFRLMEDFVLRYRNVGMAGPHYSMFVPSRTRTSPFTVNTRIFSCNLIRNDIGPSLAKVGGGPRWRGRYNEDVDLSIRILKAGWCTILFKAFLADKLASQLITGGNTEAFYADEGTAAKSEMICRLHPDIVRPVIRWGRPHHYVDFKPFAKRRLILRDDAVIPDEPSIHFTLVDRPDNRRSRRSPAVYDRSMTPTD